MTLMIMMIDDDNDDLNSDYADNRQNNVNHAASVR